MTITRRDLLRNSALAGVGVALLGSVDSVFGGSPAFAATSALGPGYGPLVPDPSGLLDLPAGFSYRIVTQSGNPLAGGGGVVPGRPDGMAAFDAGKRRTYLVQNHEQGGSAPYPAVADPSFTYDPGALGGTSTLLVDKDGTLLQQYVSLAGTYNNCAGGETPWGTWLTCEETETRAGGSLTKDHGFVFEVCPYETGPNRNPVPLTALGRFPHEAVCVDPDRGHLYLTEDASGPNGLLYRFTPRRLPNALHTLREGGTLEAMHCPELPDLSLATQIGATYAVRWKPVPDPLATTTSVRKQFDAPGAGGTPGGAITRSRKLEGAWWGNGQAYFVASYARLADGSAKEHDGQVWAYDPASSTICLQVLFSMNADPASDAPDGPDNITVSPFGGLILAEDGEGVQHLLGVSPRSETFLLARNALNDSEFAGPTFSKDRKVLYASIQDPGITLAIRGPWRRRTGLG